MAKKKNKKARNKLSTPKQVKRAVKKAAKDGEVTGKEVRQISRRSVGTVNSKTVTNLVKDQDVKAPNQTRTLAKKARGNSKDKGKDKDKGKGKGKKLDGIKSTTPAASSTGSGSTPLPVQKDVVGDLAPDQRDQKIFKRVLGKDGALTRKIQAYQDAYGGKGKASKDYLASLRSDALQRMTINPKRYGRDPKGTPFKDLSMAQQYDTNSDRLMSKLEKPLTSYFDKLDDGKGLNMFDSNRQLKFSKSKFNAFTNSPGIASTVEQKARGLGASNLGSDRVSKSLEGIGKVKNKTSADLKSKFAQDLKFIV